MWKDQNTKVRPKNLWSAVDGQAGSIVCWCQPRGLVDVQTCGATAATRTKSLCAGFVELQVRRLLLRSTAIVRKMGSCQDLG